MTLEQLRNRETLKNIAEAALGTLIIIGIFAAAVLVLWALIVHAPLVLLGLIIVGAASLVFSMCYEAIHRSGRAFFK